MAGIHSSQIESFPSAKKRVRENALYLEQHAISDGRVVLVAHGFMNRFIVKALKKQGWNLSVNTGRDYLSIQVLSRIY